MTRRSQEPSRPIPRELEDDLQKVTLRKQSRKSKFAGSQVSREPFQPRSSHFALRKGEQLSRSCSIRNRVLLSVCVSLERPIYLLTYHASHIVSHPAGTIIRTKSPSSSTRWRISSRSKCLAGFYHGRNDDRDKSRARGVDSRNCMPTLGSTSG